MTTRSVRLAMAVVLLALPFEAAWAKSFSLDLRKNQITDKRRLLSATPKVAGDGVLRSFDLDAGAADVGEVAVGDRLAFTLFDDVTIELELKEQMQSPLGGEVFLAEASGYEGIKTAVVLRTADGLTIDVQDFLNNKVYKVISTPTGVSVSEIEPSGEGKCGSDALEPPGLKGTSGGSVPSFESLAMSRDEIDELKQQYGIAEEEDAESRPARCLLASSGGGADTYVDILVAYDKGAATWVEDNGGITNFAIVAVSRMNTAIANTELDKLFRFRLVGITQVEASTDSLDTALKSATYGYSGWESIKAARDEVGADIVSVLIDTGSASGTVGLGWSLNLTSFASFSETAYNACAIRAVAQASTMAHECGHNMGCGHSDVQKTQPGPQLYEYSSGYYFTANGTAYSTIMAYGHENPSGASTTEAPYFSSPDYTFEGVAVGDAIHDNNRTILQTYASVAAFRETKVEIEIGGGDVGQDGLVWVTSRKEALAAARAANKKIFLICGRNTCGYTVATRDYSCENEMVKRHLIKDYICWYSDYDTQFNESAQYLLPYLRTGDLPLIAIIDPDEYNAIDNVNEYQSVNQLRMLLGRVAKEVSISSSAEDGLFENEVEISLASKVGANIYYTLDGTMPSEKSLRYTGPFVIADTTTITAVAIVDGFLGLPVEFTYKKKLKVLNGTHVWTAEKIKGKNECRIISVEPELTGDVIDIPSEISNCKVSGLYYKLFYYNENITSVTIPEGVTDIESYSFFFCQNLASINIPKSVTQIGRSAFVLCALTNINLEGVVKIENSTFSACRQLRDVVFSTKLKSIGDSAFETCSELINITIPDSVTSIGDAAFRDCSMLTSVTIGSGVTRIGNEAFRDCSMLTSLTIGSGVTRIGNEAFNGCNGVSEIRVKMSNIESWCVNNINSQLPDGRRRFLRGEQDEIAELIIPDSITSIGDWVFYNCVGLTRVTIPDSVTNIGERAFCACSGLTSVTIPDRVTSIGDYAFYNCVGLTSVMIPDSVTNIGERAFCACSGLTSVTIPGRVTSIGNYAFAHCRDLSSVTICNGVTVIGDFEFYNCSGLTHVLISDSVTSIGAWAFDNCKKLTSITIPASVTNIGDYAFNCSGLNSVTIPASVTNIGKKAFDGCSGLFSIEVEPENPNYKSVNGLLLTKNGKALIQGVGGDVIIPNCVTSIGCEAFANCSGLTSVTIPESVTDIGDSAFSNCGGLTNITIPASVTSMGSYVFSICISLTTITFEGNAPSCGGPLISPSYMYMCKAIVTHGSTGWGTNIPGNWNGINIIYRECTPGATTSVVNDISPTCTAEGYSGDTVCDECGAVLSTGSYLPALGHNIENIVTKKPTRTEEGVMTYYCTRCGEIIKTEPIEKLTGPTFNIVNGILSSVELNGYTEVTIPDEVIKIAYNAFRDCTELTRVIIPNGVTSIGMYAFQDCSNLESIVMPDSLTNIGSYAFNRCGKLKSVDLPSNVMNIGDGVFRECSKLTDITIPDGVENISKQMFLSCESLTNITIGAGVKIIGEYAFLGCNGLTSVIIPDGVTSIGSFAFSGCSNLINVVIPNTVTNIASCAFYNCSGITSLTIPDGVTNIESNAFSGCSKLNSIAIPGTVTSIGDGAFSRCSSLQTAYLPNTLESSGIASSTFSDAFVSYYDPPLRFVTVTFDANGGDGTMLDSQMVKGAPGILPVLIFANAGHLFDGWSTTPNGDVEYEDGSVVSFSDDTVLYAIWRQRLHVTFNANGGDGIMLQQEFGMGMSKAIARNVFTRPVMRFVGWALSEDGDVVYGDEEEIEIFENITLFAKWEKDMIWTIADGKLSAVDMNGLSVAVIPDGVKRLGDSLFAGCSNLTCVVLPEGLEVIGNSAFENCVNLTSVNIPDSVTDIWVGAFYGCCNLDSITIPNSVNSISSSAFSECSSLTNINIPGSVDLVGWHAFHGCSSLTNVTINEGVTSIGPYAFDSCSNLVSIVMPSTITNIDSYVFYKCEKLKSVDIPRNVTNIGIGAFRGCSSITDINIPDGVTNICKQAFYGCKSITNLTIGANVKVIGTYAFYGCSSLTSVMIPDGVTNIESSAFSSCSELNRIAIPSTVTSIGEYAFSWCSSLRTVYLPNTLEANGISSSTFSSASIIYYEPPLRFVTVTFEANGGYGTMLDFQMVKGYSEKLPGPTFANAGYSFKGWATEPDGEIEYVDGAGVAFSEDTTLYAVWKRIVTVSFNSNGGSGTMADVKTEADAESKLPNGSFTNAGHSFEGWATEPDGEVVYVDGATVAFNSDITLYAVWSDGPSCTVVNGVLTAVDMNGYDSIVIPSSVTSIGRLVFYGNTSLRSVFVPVGVNKIEIYAFYNCENLTEVVLPDGLTQIDNCAFAGCKSLEYIDIPNSVTNIDRSFRNCESLKEIVLPSGLKILNGDVFRWCISLEEIVIPAGITSISDRMFSDCSSLEHVEMQGPVVSIGWAAFQNCVKLRSIILPESVKSIGGRAFADCTNLRLLCAPKGLTFPDDAFEGCPDDLRIIYYTGKKEDIEWATLEYDGNGGEGDMSDEVIISGEPFKLSKNKFANAGFCFMGWSSQRDGEVEYPDEGEICLTETTTLYAVWAEDVYDINTESLPAAMEMCPYEFQLEASGGVPPYTWTPLFCSYAVSYANNTFDQTGTAQGWDRTFGSWEYELPFEFSFYGKTYPTVFVNNNGTLSFGDSFTAVTANWNSFTNAVVVAPMYTLFTSNSSWGSDVFISATDTDVTFRWDRYSTYASAGVRFSATLSKDGTIRFAYESQFDADRFYIIGISCGDQMRCLTVERDASSTNDIVFSPIWGVGTVEFPEGISLSVDGVLSGTPTKAGEYEIKVGATDAIRNRVDKAFAFTVAENTNERPVINSFAPEEAVSLPTGTSKRFKVGASDPEGGALTYRWELDGETILGATGNEYVYAPGEGDEGEHTLVCYISDDLWREVVSQSWTVSVTQTIRITPLTTIEELEIMTRFKSPGRILFAPGEYDLSSVDFYTLSRGSVILEGEDGAANTIIRSGLDFYYGSTVIKGLTVEGGLSLEETINQSAEPNIVEGCVIRNCQVTVYSTRLINCVITDCNCSFNGVQAEFCTIAGNEKVSFKGGPGYSGDEISCTLVNSIVWDNDALTFVDGTEIDGCCIDEAYAGLGESNITAEPMFADAEGGDFRLRASSPCADTAIIYDDMPEVDIDGSNRIQGEAPNMGACEETIDGCFIVKRVSGHGTVTADKVCVEEGGAITFTASGLRPFIRYETNGVFATSDSTFTWEDIRHDGVLTAVFDEYTWYVDAQYGEDANDGLSADAPKRTIQNAVDNSLPGEDILVAPGTYESVITSNKAVRVLATGEIGSAAIDGDFAERCVTVATSTSSSTMETNTVFYGFVIRNGYATQGYGGGVLGGTFQNCIISNCVANSAGIPRGGGAGYAVLKNSLVVGNGTSGSNYGYGGGTYESILYGCTVADNNAGTKYGEGGGVYGGRIYNSIIWGNTVNTANPKDGNVASIYNSAYKVNCWTSDPAFRNPETGDYRLAENSLCIDAGDNSYAFGDVELNGDSRIFGGIVDIGAYEYYRDVWTIDENSVLTSVYLNGATEATIPDGVKRIGDGAFSGYNSLASITIPDSVVSIGSSAFYGCSNLTCITIPDSVTSIGDGAFSGCSGLTQVNITDLEKWCKISFGGYYANPLSYAHNLYLDGVLVEDLIIPGSVTCVGEYAFNGGSCIKSLKLHDGVTKIGTSAFHYCSGMTSVTIGKGVTSIGDYAFFACWDLAGIEIPDSVTRIGGNAFQWCFGLRSIAIPSSVMNIGYYAFDGCDNVCEATVPGKRCGIPFGNVTNLVISAGTTCIGYYAFDNCSKLTSITIPDSVTSIENGAFYGCSGLESVTIPASVTSIWYAFSDCSGLKSVKFNGDEPEFWGSYGFAGVAEGCVARVSRTATGFAVDEDGKWQGMTVEYYNPPNWPEVEGDEDAEITWDQVNGYVVKPSAEIVNVEVKIIKGMTAEEVTVQVGTGVETVKANGANIKVVKGEHDITEYLEIPAADGDGVTDMTKAEVKQEVANEALDEDKGAVVRLVDIEAPRIVTSATKPGLRYTLREGTQAADLKDGDSKEGDGEPWTPSISVKDGDSAFYTIKVEK